MTPSTRIDGSLLAHISKSASSLTVLAYRPEHLSQFTPQESQHDYRNVEEECPNFSEEIDVEDYSFTLVDKYGEIVSCLGVFPNEDIGLAWAIHSELFHNHVIEVTRLSRACFDKLQEKKAFKSLFGTVKNGYEGGHKWMKALKFEETEDQFDVSGTEFTLYGRTL